MVIFVVKDINHLALSISFSASLSIHHSIHHGADSSRHWTLDHLHSSCLHQLSLLHSHSLPHCVGTLLGQSLTLGHHHGCGCCKCGSTIRWHSSDLTKGASIALRAHTHRWHRALLLRWRLLLNRNLCSWLTLVSLCLACMRYASKRALQLSCKTSRRSIKTPRCINNCNIGWRSCATSLFFLSSSSFSLSFWLCIGLSWGLIWRLRWCLSGSCLRCLGSFVMRISDNSLRTDALSEQFAGHLI